ncbi:AAC(3) family N-acetyltransferase [Longimicrobium sp.]|uniref:AAC(3) family N-acetyltransferase n=1 Tax=Longimicrobium sp. TaxID=2029185 RepID=UPI002E323CED|nr:AAC(3) family N-acetyltransferase [Longimicrobium sp.]HEX6037054.1 AAC(3) family N-acetyltransferase [Longimicrobium sp.]
MLTRAQAVEQFRATGITPGDTVMVHSAFRSLGPVEGGPDTVIDALLELVGPEGTVLFPTFNFHAWTEAHYWDSDETPSEMGALTEIARRRPGAVRTPHPIYSFAVLGARQAGFAACDDVEAFGPRSAFALFHRLDGLIVSIGLDWNSTFTLTHFIERENDASYRRTKRFGGIYLLPGQPPAVREFTMFVRRDETRTRINPAMDELAGRGVVGITPVGEAGVAFCRAGRFYTELAPIVRERPHLLHHTVQRGG